LTREQAQAYFNSIPASEQQAVQASGADILAWANASEAAGDPRALSHSGTYLQGGGDTYGGKVATGGEPSSAWLGQRKPTPAELRAWGAGRSEDYLRYEDRQLAAWIASSWDVAAGGFRNEAGDLVDKPTESGAQSRAQGWATGEASTAGGGGGGGGGGFGGGGGGYGGATTGFGGAPAFQYDPFKPPLPGDTTTDPSYLFRVKEGQDALERSASARGVLRTSGTLKDILDWGQGAASQEYQNIYNRGLSTWGAQYQGQKDAFAPQYGSWSTVYGGDLSKYLQRENNIYGLLNQPAPTPPYYG
jgi:hypothetical protein